MAASSLTYFAPTYFSPFYFPTLKAGSGSSGSTALLYRDRDAFSSIASGLTATGEFADVFFGPSPGMRAAGANRSPAALITPEGWTEIDDSDPILVVRHVTYTLTIIVRDEDPLARYELLDRLSCVAQNAIDGSDLVGVCLPGLTKLRRGRFDQKPNHPEQSVVLVGEFSYVIPSFTGHNTRDPYA